MISPQIGGLPLPKILFVDDDENIRAVVKGLLPSAGFDTTIAADAVEAMSLFELAPESYDLVITDFSMPGTGGIGLAHSLRVLRPDIPILFCSGMDLSGCMNELAALGVEHILNKPLSGETLIKVIKKVIAAAN